MWYLIYICLISNLRTNVQKPIAFKYLKEFNSRRKAGQQPLRKLYITITSGSVNVTFINL